MTNPTNVRNLEISHHHFHHSTGRTYVLNHEIWTSIISQLKTQLFQEQHT